ncbi:hypothetical protein [Rheinheimera salexigens]|uniref:PEP-CTERM protein-sorting domain-containing protein n=1 Tax=Rheinheimera salexigens TaxID=1628148 RepID=A0A1E7Q5I2_9GAMM|nr:hypothetical protein [Rheinheimera salexigens]OEY69425.1 hypothetical protein BI198_07490 [Rheinheimera salexigens]
MDMLSNRVVSPFVLLLTFCFSLFFIPANASLLGLSVLGSGSCSNVNSRLEGQEIFLDKQMNAIAPCDLEFTLFGTSSFVVDNLLFSERVFNDSGIAWGDYHLILGIGFGIDFEESDNNDSRHFRRESGMLPSNSDFAQILLDPSDLAPDSLDFGGGTGVDFGAYTEFNFALAGLFDSDGDGEITFTIRQIPTISEPSTVSLLGFSVIGLLLLNLKRKV